MQLGEEFSHAILRAVKEFAFDARLAFASSALQWVPQLPSIITKNSEEYRTFAKNNHYKKQQQIPFQNNSIMFQTLVMMSMIRMNP